MLGMFVYNIWTKFWAFELRWNHYSNVIEDEILLVLGLVSFISFEIRCD